MSTPVERLEHALSNPKRPGRPALVPYLTAGWPNKETFSQLLSDVSKVADAVELGVPFTDPMADGITIQDTSREALEQGVTLRWIFEMLHNTELHAPVLLMGYVNPFLAFGLERLAAEGAEAGVGAFIVPDLAFEESDLFRVPLEAAGCGLVQLVTPVTPQERAERLIATSRGFVYAVTMRGTTGARALPAEVPAYLDRIRAAASIPVCAGFGIRSAEQVNMLAPHADGVVVGSGLLDAVRRGDDAVGWLQALISDT